MLLTRDGGFEESQSPEWSDVESSLHRLDGVKYTEVGLFVNDDCYLQIGGGRDCYVCSIRANGKLHVLTDNRRSSTTMKWVVAGEGAEYPERECFCLKAVLDVARWFLANKTPSPHFGWKMF